MAAGQLDEFAAWIDAHAETHLPYLAVVDGVPVGSAWLLVAERVPAGGSFDRRYGDIQAVFVREAYRNRGIGGALITYCRLATTRAVVTDLVRPDGTVSAATRLAASQLHAAGVPLIAATARTPAGLSVLGPVLNDVTLAVCCNGSLGHAPGAEAPLWRRTVSAVVVAEIVSVLAKHLPDAGFGAYDGQAWSLSATYFRARRRWPSGSHKLATPDEISRVDACAMGICHPWITSAEIAVHAGWRDRLFTSVTQLSR